MTVRNLLQPLSRPASDDRRVLALSCQSITQNSEQANLSYQAVFDVNYYYLTVILSVP